MPGRTKRFEGGKARRSTDGAFGRSLSRRSFLGAGALIGLAAMAMPTERAWAWSSWTNATSGMLKSYGMGDCVHEDLVQISYARLVRNHRNDGATPDSLLNPWAGVLADDRLTATIAGDTVERGKSKSGEDLAFADENDLAVRLFRENLAYLRIGSFWNDAAANTLTDFGYSCYYANSVPKFSGADRYEGAWDVGQHIWETNEKNKTYWIEGLDALVQFTMNDRNNFIHGMLSSTASHSAHLRQSEVKQFALQWLGVAYEYARTGEVQATSDVTQEQAEKIFKGFIDTYGQLDKNAYGMRVSLKVSDAEASLSIPRRRLRLRALGMMCHTLEDFWCPAHTCRTYHVDGSIPQNAILAFCNYKLQNGSNPPMIGYHIPFDRYALSDANDGINWREALTRGTKDYPGTEKLANVLAADMSVLDNAHTYFNTLGMNETIGCITKLFEYLYEGTAWDDGVRSWIDTEVMPTYFDDNGQSLVCDAGRRCLHTPTYIIAPIKAMERAYGKVGLESNHAEAVRAAKAYDVWQRGAHSFYSGKHNVHGAKYIAAGLESYSIWDDDEGESRLVALVDKLYEGYETLDDAKRSVLLSHVGCNGCHNMVAALGRIRGMLQEFNIDLRGDLRPEGDGIMGRLSELLSFFRSGLKGQGTKTASDAMAVQSLLATAADEDGEAYETSSMAIEYLVGFDDGSYRIAVRDMDSLETSVMLIPEGTPGIDRLSEGIGNLTITYTLETEFDDDLDYSYVVTSIDYTDLEEDIHFLNGTVKSVAADGKSLVLDLNGLAEYTLTIREGMSAPQAGAYVCVWYTKSDSALEMVGYDDIDEPGDLVEVTHTVEMVAGSRMWLLAQDEGDAEDGYRDLIQIDYGYADVFDMPREGEKVTVLYYDESYGDATGVDESGLATASFASGFASVSAQADDDDLDDSVDTPGYIELGDEYGKLTYGNEWYHVASAIGRPEEQPVPTPPASEDPKGSGGTDGPGGDQSDQQTPKPNPKAPAASAKTSKQPLPKTADSLVGLEGLLSATAVAGAALGAGLSQRGANEREDPEKD